MANEVMVKQVPKPEVYAVSGIFLLLGVGAILLWAKQKPQTGYGDMKQIAPGEFISMPISPTLEGGDVIAMRIGQTIPAMIPSVMYQGPGRDTFSYFRIVQNQGGQEVTVQGSGVAGVHVGPCDEPSVFYLVSPDQVQPPGCPAQALCAYTWPGPIPTPICGAPPQPGYATALLEIYQVGAPQDADGFSSPTCGTDEYPVPRVPVVWKRYTSKILYSI
jgi:hypothetical protein